MSQCSDKQLIPKSKTLVFSGVLSSPSDNFYRLPHSHWAINSASTMKLQM